MIILSDLGIVMPLYYQKEEHIRIAIKSTLNQTHKDFIFYIVIDGALDLLPIVNDEIKGDERVKIISYNENKGVAYALNKGFEELYQIPTIQYVTWVSSDNIYYPDFLQILYEGIVNSPTDVGIVYTSFHQILDDGTPIDESLYLENLRQFQGGSSDGMFEGCIIGPAFIHRIEYCKMVDPYRLTLIQDYDYWMRMMDHCTIIYIPIETMAYRINSPFSLSTSINSKPEYHRICWNEVHLAHYETRKRRGIKPELTIVYFLYQATEDTLKKYGEIIDQYWTNYKLFLINCSPTNNLKEINEIYYDLRVAYIDCVNTNPTNELSKVISNLDTPYFMFCDGSVSFSEPTKLKTLINTLKGDLNCKSVHYDPSGNIVTSSTVNTTKLEPYVIIRGLDN